MNLPSLPTDNLYKFMALSGLIVIIFSYLVVYREADRSQKILREMQAQAIKLNKSLDAKGLADAPTYSDIISDFEKLKLNEAELAYILKNKHWTLGFFIISQVIGFYLTITGFRLWYLRIQNIKILY